MQWHHWTPEHTAALLQLWRQAPAAHAREFAACLSLELGAPVRRRDVIMQLWLLADAQPPAVTLSDAERRARLAWEEDEPLED